MGIKQRLAVRSEVLKDSVNKYAIIGLGISILSIIIASVFASYQQTGSIDFAGIIHAQKTNPALWALDLTPFMFAYWGQLFCYEMASTMETIIEDKTRELLNKSSDLELKLQYETNHDHLTNLPNQRLLSQRIMQGIQQLNEGEELAVILLHINFFKDINFKYGSFNGNSLLVQFAEKLKTVLLEPYLLQAYMGMNMVARVQGAEFALLIPRLKKEHRLDDLLIKILASTSASFMIDGNSINITTTAGIALYPLHGKDDLSLIRHASISLFHAEKEGVSYAMYEPAMDKNMQTDRVKLKELSSAIDNEKMGLLYQPEIELKTENIIGFEAVVHLDDAKYGVIYADELLPIIEGTVLVRKLTNLMIKTAVKQLASWKKIKQKIYVTVNLFDATDMELPSLVEALLKENDIPPEYLKLALTEKACLSDQTRSIIVLKELADLGVKLVISDFCSGYTSFIYLTNFPISELKMDKSFIMNMSTDKKKMSIVKTVLKVAEAMGLVIFADGIVDKNSLEELIKLGYEYGQAPYLTPAVLADKVPALLPKK